MTIQLLNNFSSTINFTQVSLSSTTVTTATFSITTTQICNVYYAINLKSAGLTPDFNVTKQAVTVGFVYDSSNSAQTQLGRLPIPTANQAFSLVVANLYSN